MSADSRGRQRRVQRYFGKRTTKRTPGSATEEATALRNLILGMRAAYARGQNAMAFARRATGARVNSTIGTLIGYDLQAGSYIAAVRASPEVSARWCAQIAAILDPLVPVGSSILEVGSGEATTLAGVIQRLARAPRHKLGLDISWSRCAAGLGWLAERNTSATLFVADLFNIPLADRSIDIVYTSHSIEPNGGRETEALRELMRVARRAVVLVEPIYELAKPAARSRMRSHGYVRGLKVTAQRLGATVLEYRLLDYAPNPLNPSGLLLISTSGCTSAANENSRQLPAWRCPITQTPLKDAGDVFVAEQVGLVYPVLRGIPLLRIEHGIVASKIFG